MENKLLQPLLQAGLLDIGDSDERLANIEKSIEELQKKFVADHGMIKKYTLAALDPNISETEESIIEVENIIVSHWKALRAKFPERPVAIIRAVIINALYNAGIESSYIAHLFVLTASNFYPYAKLGREKDVLEKMIIELGDIAEKAAEAEWQLKEEEPNLKLSPLKISALQFATVTVDDSTLKSKLAKAGKHSPDGYNPYSHPNEWSTYFSQQASEGIVNAIQTTVDKLGSSLTPASLETPINKYFADFKKSLEQILNTTMNSQKAIERRSRLLWWKETLYSKTLKNSYRTLNTELQPIVMAYELYDDLPAIVPVSVEFLLKDTLNIVNKSTYDQITFQDYLTALLTSENKKFLHHFFKEEVFNGRIGLVDFIQLTIYDKATITDFKAFTGIDLESHVTYADVAAMIYRDLFINYLSSH